MHFLKKWNIFCGYLSQNFPLVLLLNLLKNSSIARIIRLNPSLIFVSEYDNIKNINGDKKDSDAC